MHVSVQLAVPERLLDEIRVFDEIIVEEACPGRAGDVEAALDRVAQLLPPAGEPATVDDLVPLLTEEHTAAGERLTFRLAPDELDAFDGVDWGEQLLRRAEEMGLGAHPDVEVLSLRSGLSATDFVLVAFLPGVTARPDMAEQLDTSFDGAVEVDQREVSVDGVEAVELEHRLDPLAGTRHPYVERHLVIPQLDGVIVVEIWGNALEGEPFVLADAIVATFEIAA